MNPKDFYYTPISPCPNSTPTFASKEDKARHELEEGGYREQTLKNLHTEKDREVKQAKLELQRLEESRQDTARALQTVRQRNEKLREFLKLAEEI